MFLSGSLFSVMMVVGNTASLTSSLLSNKIYASTLFLMEGFVFLVGALMKIFALLVLGYVL